MAERSTDEHALLAAAQATPRVVALTNRELAVENGDRLAEVLLEAPHHLPSEGDFWHQDDCAASLAANACATSWMYTRVLPEPVTPCSRGRIECPGVERGRQRC